MIKRASLYLIVLVACLSLMGCRGKGSLQRQLIGHWTVDAKQTMASLEQTPRWETMDNQQRAMARKVLTNMLRSMQVSFTPEKTITTIGKNRRENSYRILKAENKTMVVASHFQDRDQEVLIEFLDKHTIRFTPLDSSDNTHFIFQRIR